MLLGIAGITGVGKSYFKDKIVEKLGFEKVKIITTRSMREGEKNNDDKIFIDIKELQNLRDNDKIAYDFEMLGNWYAYTKEDLFTDKNIVFEVHWNTIYELKKICPHMKVLYIFPQDIEIAKEKTRERHLEPEVERKRLLEINEHYKKITTDKNLKSMFDFILYNNYDKPSEDAIINFVKNLILKEN